ncbi:MAG: ABC transporter permease [Myxococcota bacterium]
MLFSMALRNALRNRRRSMLTATTVLLGVALLTLAMCWIEGVVSGMLDRSVKQIGPVRVVDPEFAKREQLMPLYENIADSAPLEAQLRDVPGVTGVYPRIQMGVTVTVGELIGEKFGLVIGAPIAYFDEVVDLDQTLREGAMLAGDEELVVGAEVAEQTGAKVGDDVVLLGQTQDGSLSAKKLKLVGIADLGNAQQNRLLFVTLEQARYMADMDGGAVELLVYGPPTDEADELAAAIRALPGMDTWSVKAWSERPPFSDMMGIFTTVRGIAASAIVLITALGVLNTMLMSVLERTAEIGVLRALGLKRREVVSLFVIEALGIAFVGGVLGAALGGLGGWWLQVHGVDLGSAVDKMPMPFNSRVYGKLTPEILAGGVALGLVMAVVGGLVPAFRASHIQPVEAMRSRR